MIADVPMESVASFPCSGAVLDSSMNSSLWEKELQGEPETVSSFDAHTAANMGNKWAMLDIRQRDAGSLNKKNKAGWTPLMYACYNGHSRIVELLLNFGVNQTERNNNGSTHLMLAASSGDDKSVELLLQNNASVDAKDRRDWTPLFYAVSIGHHSIVHMLLQHGANVNAVENVHGYTAAMMAALDGNCKILKILLEHGADVTVKSYDRKTAQTLALDKGHSKAAEMIVYNSLKQSLTAKNSISQDKEKPAKIPEPLYQLDDAESSIDIARIVKEITGGRIPTLMKEATTPPRNLKELLEGLNLTKYFNFFQERGIDLKMFLKCSENDLKEIGISLMGPRKKMVLAISRWKEEVPG